MLKIIKCGFSIYAISYSLYRPICVMSGCRGRVWNLSPLVSVHVRNGSDGGRVGGTQTLVSLLVTVWRRGERLRHEWRHCLAVIRQFVASVPRATADARGLRTPIAQIRTSRTVNRRRTVVTEMWRPEVAFSTEGRHNFDVPRTTLCHMFCRMASYKNLEL